MGGDAPACSAAGIKSRGWFSFQPLAWPVDFRSSAPHHISLNNNKTTINQAGRGVCIYSLCPMPTWPVVFLSYTCFV